MLTKNDLEQIDKLLKNRLDDRINPLEKRMGTFEGLQKRQGKKLDLIISYFDRDITRLARKVDRLEKHAGLLPSE